MKKILFIALITVILAVVTACYIPRNGLYDNEMGTRYFVNDVYQTGWIEIDGKEYYFSLVDGYMVHESQEIEGVWYGINPDGTRANGFVKEENGTRYYVDGLYVTDWQEINGERYYFAKENGIMVTGNYEISGYIHTFAEDGRYTPYTGLKNDVYGTKYYVNDIYQKGWQEIDGEKYYFSRVDGYMVCNSQNIEGMWYGITHEGKLAKGFLKDNDGTRYYDDNSHYVTGWQEIAGERYYFVKATGLMVTGEYTISDVVYTFSEDGKLIG